MMEYKLVTYVLLFLGGSIAFAVSLVHVLEKFSKRSIKTRIAVAAQISFIGLSIIIFKETDHEIFSKIMNKSIMIIGALSAFLWTIKNWYGENIVKKTFKSISVCILISWFYIHLQSSVSFVVEGTLIFLIGYILILLPLIYEEKDLIKEFPEK